MSEASTVIDLTEAAAPAAAAAPAPVSMDAPIAVDEKPDADKLPGRAVVNKDGSVTLPLLTPVTLTWRKGGVDTQEVVSSLTLRRLSGKDMRKIMSSTGEAFTTNLTAASVQAQYNAMQWNAIFDRLDGADAMDVFLVAQSFLQSGPQTPGR